MKLLGTSQQIAGSTGCRKGTERSTTDPDLTMGNRPSEDAGDADLAPGNGEIRSASRPVLHEDGPARHEICRDHPPMTVLGSAAENSTIFVTYL